MRIVAGYLIATVITLGSVMVSAESLRTDYLTSRLISQSETAVPGIPLLLGLLLEHDAGWHTYWQNPGDSGLPTRISLSINGEQQGEFHWPLPARFPLDDQLVNFGYKGRVVLPLTVQIPADMEAGSLQIEARASWLVCEDACIPGSGEYRLTLPLASTASPDPRWQADFDKAARRQPRQLPAGSRFTVGVDQVTLRMPKALFPGKPTGWVFFPVTTEVVRNSQEPEWRLDGPGWVAVLEKNEYFTRPPAQFDWLLVRGDDGIHVSATADTL
jgi:DsbC/DsbD-like thiol-disulfide interchange protein